MRANVCRSNFYKKEKKTDSTLTCHSVCTCICVYLYVRTTLLLYRGIRRRSLYTNIRVYKVLTARRLHSVWTFSSSAHYPGDRVHPYLLCAPQVDLSRRSHRTPNRTGGGAGDETLIPLHILFSHRGWGEGATSSSIGPKYPFTFHSTPLFANTAMVARRIVGRGHLNFKNNLSKLKKN